MVSNIFLYFFCFHPYLGKWSNLSNTFQLGWNHQLEKISTLIRGAISKRKGEAYLSPNGKGAKELQISKRSHGLRTLIRGATPLGLARRRHVVSWSSVQHQTEASGRRTATVAASSDILDHDFLAAAMQVAFLKTVAQEDDLEDAELMSFSKDFDQTPDEEDPLCWGRSNGPH